MSMIAKTLRKPFYVAVESYKFARMYPLSQTDVSDMCGDSSTSDTFFKCSSGKVPVVIAPTAVQQPVIDFTPAEYISLLFTDLGILTPAAVSDELIRLYQ